MSAARDRKDDALAALRAPAFVELAGRSRRGGWRSGSTGVMTPAGSSVAVMMTHADCRRRDRRTHDEVGGARIEDDPLVALRALASVELAGKSRRGGWRSGSTGVVTSTEGGGEVMMTHAPSDRAVGGRTTRSAAPDLKDDALAALRALAFAELAGGAGAVVGGAAARAW